MEAATLAEEIHTVVSTAASWPELAPGEADKQVSKFWSTRLPVSNLTHENQTWKFTAFSSSLNGQEVCKGPYQTSKTFKVCYEPAGWKYTSPLSPVAQASLSLFLFKKTVLVFKSLPILTPALLQSQGCISDKGAMAVWCPWQGSIPWMGVQTALSKHSQFRVSTGLVSGACTRAAPPWQRLCWTTGSVLQGGGCRLRMKQGGEGPLLH